MREPEAELFLREPSAVASDALEDRMDVRPEIKPVRSMDVLGWWERELLEPPRGAVNRFWFLL